MQKQETFRIDPLLYKYFWDHTRNASDIFKLKRLLEYASFPDLLKIPFEILKSNIHHIDVETLRTSETRRRFVKEVQNYFDSSSDWDETLYFLKNGRELTQNIKTPGHYVNWCRIFYFLSRLLTFASTGPWADDAYLLSSLFRDVSGEAAIIGRYFNILLPENNLFKGENLFAPFTEALFKMLDKINE